MSKLKAATSSGEIRARDALLGYWWHEKSEVDKIIAWYKYKRCLAMSEICTQRAKYCGETHDCITASRMYHWRKRWLDIAQQFKEAL